MKNDKLLEIDHTLTSINPEIEDSECLQPSSSIYYKAIRDLKEVHQKIASIKARINNMIVKKNRSAYQTPLIDRQTTLRMKFLKQQQKKDSRRTKLQKIKANSEAQLKKVYVENKKQEIMKNIDKARRNMTEAKFKSLDQVREKSLENLRKIQTTKRALFEQNRLKHDQLYTNQKRHRKIMQEIQQSKQKQIRQFCSLQTKLVYTKIQQKKEQLNQMENQCFNYEKKLKYIAHKNHKKTKIVRNSRKKLAALSITHENKSQETMIPAQSRIKFDTIQ